MSKQWFWFTGKMILFSYTKKRALLLIAFVCACANHLLAQQEFGFKMPDGIRRVEIPFELHNNLIVIPIKINKFITLKFILDTGVETAILTEKLYGDILRLNYQREITIKGPGIQDSVEAYLATGATFSLPGDVIGQNMNLLVLREDYLKLSQSIGENVYGIIGYDVFSRFVVDINYDRKILTLRDAKRYKARGRRTRIPLKVQKTKPFIPCEIQDGKDKIRTDIMVDTGASHVALLDYNQIDGMQLPSPVLPTRLGRGVAGEITGVLGRISKIEIDDQLVLEDPIISIPSEGAYFDVIKRGSRVGTLGGELLRRFRVIFDYQHNALYLKKSSKFKDKFQYDMSGMSLNTTGLALDTLLVINVLPEQPAANAGIRIGDVILSINGSTIENKSLTYFTQLLRRKEGLKIKCKILRNDEKINTEFRLRKII
ncbi:MAG: aspartyl protease family protein [Bacteroidota bacterium]